MLVTFKHTDTDFPSDSKKITIEIYEPDGTGPFPSVIIFSGFEGMNNPFGDQIRSFAQDLAEAGFVTTIPQYFESTSTKPGVDVFTEILSSQAKWEDTLDDAILFTANRSKVDKDRIGLLGFSLGALMAIRKAKDAPNGLKPKVLVDFFGPTSFPLVDMKIDSVLGDNIDLLPPTQIHHGDADIPVPLQNSKDLVALLKTAGVEHELHVYPGEGHGFKDDALAKSKDRTMTFMQSHI